MEDWAERESPSKVMPPNKRPALPDLFSSPMGGNVVGGGDTPVAPAALLLEHGLGLVDLSPAHLVIRGTALGDSVRCEWRGVARTMEQREAAIRFWFGLEEMDPLPSTAEAERALMAEITRLGPVYPETLRANFRSLARGGMSDDFVFLSCYADFSVQEYVLGSGGTRVTVAYDRMSEFRSYELYQLAHAAGEFGDEDLLPPGEYEVHRAQRTFDLELVMSALLGGREGVIFLAPMGAHNAIAVEAWQVVAQWDLQTDDEGVVQAVRYGADEGDSEYTQTLANLKSRVVTAAASDSHAGNRIANVSGLTQYYRDMGAYSDITPDDGSTETFTPAQPPPVPQCASGAAVADALVNRPLVHDCETLLELMSTLAGTATLNWSADLALGSWTGVTVSGTPQRVTGLSVSSSSLSGIIPVELGTLWSLETLDLSSNSLTGSIPAELGHLPDLGTLRLSGNSLSGCIPAVLRDVAVNDLASLNLLYCDMLPLPAAPGNLSVSLLDGTFTLSWDAVSGAANYEAQHRASETREWTALPEVDATTPTTVYAPDGGPVCETTYRFQVRAFGDGMALRSEWGVPSAETTHTTGSCNTAPDFDPDSYAFTVAEDEAVDYVVGTVSATDTDEEDTVSYSITGGKTRMANST